MNNEQSKREGNSAASTPLPELQLSDYQMAVLSTLFDQKDSGKVIDLAKQWGYEQDSLCSVWSAMHAGMFSQETIASSNL
jgi:hypothetical protein